MLTVLQPGKSKIKAPTNLVPGEDLFCRDRASCYVSLIHQCRNKVILHSHCYNGDLNSGAPDAVTSPILQLRKLKHKVA
jgi:hypothetical protein